MTDTPKFQKRHTRASACSFLSERLGCRVSPGTLRRWPVPYKQVRGDASYLESDLERFVEERLESAPDRMPKASP